MTSIKEILINVFFWLNKPKILINVLNEFNYFSLMNTNKCFLLTESFVSHILPPILSIRNNLLFSYIK